MSERSPEPGAPGRLRLPLLREILDLGLEAAGEVWPAPTLALGALYERGARFLTGDDGLPRIAGRADPAFLDALHAAREELLMLEALYLATRQATYALTVESEALEAEWLRLADRHLEIRGEIVSRRRDEEQLKRELSALGGATVPLPEHDDLPTSEAGRPRKSRGMFDQLFAGASLVEAELAVAPEVRALADEAIRARGWRAEWGEHGPLVVLTHGISLALREREADAVNGDDEASVRRAQEEVRARLMRLEGRYSTLRRRLFELRHNNRILGWRITALEIEAQGMRRRLDQFLTDRERLEQEIEKRRGRGASARQETPAAPGADRAGGWRQRLARLFGRRG